MKIRSRINDEQSLGERVSMAIINLATSVAFAITPPVVGVNEGASTDGYQPPKRDTISALDNKNVSYDQPAEHRLVEKGVFALTDRSVRISEANKSYEDALSGPGPDGELDTQIETKYPLGDVDSLKIHPQLGERSSQQYRKNISHTREPSLENLHEMDPLDPLFGLRLDLQKGLNLKAMSEMTRFQHPDSTKRYEILRVSVNFGANKGSTTPRNYVIISGDEK